MKTEHYLKTSTINNMELKYYYINLNHVPIETYYLFLHRKYVELEVPIDEYSHSVFNTHF